MIKKVTITLSSGRVLVCGMDKVSLRTFKEEVENHPKKFIDVDAFVTEKARTEGMNMWVKSDKIETIMVENVSNIAVPQQGIILPGGEPPSAA